MNNLLTEGVRVKILGREYEMDPGTLTPLEVESLARFVDERMQDISDRFSIVDTQKIAVLAAINIALDYLQLKEQGFAKSDDVTPQLDILANKLEEALKP